MSVKLECVYCKTEFIAKSRRAKYCSKKCKDTVFRINRGIKCNPNTEPYHKICECCGKPFDTFRKATTTCSHECSIKRKRKLDKNRERHDLRYKHTKEEWLQILKQQAERKEIEKKWYRLSHTEKRECKICGTLFYCLDTETKQTCSSECSKAYRKAKAIEKSDKRLNKNNIVDTDISLERLYKRDNGICYLCGGICNKSDYVLRGKIKICGKSYPSIDHVIPLARGGKHQWENVRLAHLGCNIDKSDTTPTYTKEMSREYARKTASLRATNKRKTAQYTLDRRLLKIWESTGQIERELGLNSKHIQNVCREAKTGNAYGFHWEYICQ